MHYSRFRFIMLLIMVWGLFILASCGQEDKQEAGPVVPEQQEANSPPVTEPAPVPEKAPDPVHIRMLIWDVTIPDEMFQRWIAEPVNRKYPHITIELVRRTPPETLAQLVAAGNFPDMIYEGSKTIDQFNTLEIAENLLPYIKKHNLDLNMYEPIFLDALQMYTANDILMSLPFNLTFDALFYNKDIFDKFSVDYPKDGITWEELLPLAKRVTVNDGRETYHGIRVTRNTETFGSPFALEVYDEKTGKAAIATDGWKRVFEIYRELETFSGSIISTPAMDDFVIKQSLAMFTNAGSATVEQIQIAADQGVALNWDMIKYPAFQGNRDSGLELSGHVLLMSRTSKHKDEVFQVMAFLADQEVQLKVTEDGRKPGIKDTSLLAHFGKNIPVLQGKNMSPVYQSSAPAVTRTGFHDVARRAIRPAAALTTPFMLGQSDVNTTLREAEEAANKAIEEAKISK